jgi:hypothetical protein
MSGSLRVLPEELPAEKHDHVDLVMSNGKVLHYTDHVALVPGSGPKSWKATTCWPISALNRSAMRLTPIICNRSV